MQKDAGIFRKVDFGKPLTDLLKDVPGERRHQIKAEALRLAARRMWDARGEGGHRWEQDGVTFRLTRKPQREENGLLVVWVRAWQGDEELPLGATDTLPEANPFGFMNPPLCAPTGRKVRASGMDGRQIERDEMREDADAALRSIVASAVLEAARARGWK